MPVISLRVRAPGQASSPLAPIAALALAAALIACQPVGPVNTDSTEAPRPPTSAAGASVGRATGTMDGSLGHTLSGGDFSEEGTRTYSITVRLAWSPAADGGAGGWVDDGSTYTLTGTSSRTQHVTIGSGSCDVVSLFGDSGGGSFGVGDSELKSSGADGSSRLEIGGRLAYTENSSIDTCGTVTTDEMASTMAFPPESCQSEEPPILGPYPPANSRRVFEWSCDSSTAGSTSQFTGQVEVICWPQPVSCPTWE
jgi:hypothetical protein